MRNELPSSFGNPMQRGSKNKHETFFWIVIIGAVSIAFFFTILPNTFWEEIFNRGDGRSSPQLAQAFPFLTGVLGILLSIIGLLFFFQGTRIDRWLKLLAETTTPTSYKENVSWALLVCILVLVFDGRTLPLGYFERDDFDLISLDREHSLGDLIVTTHNDHSVALLRVEVRVMQMLFGTNTFAYNIAILCSFIALLTAGTWLLRDCGVSRLATMVFLLLCISSTLWGRYTTGHYIIQKYMQIATATAISLWFWRRWTFTGNHYWLGGISICLAFTCWMNISGFWSPLALFAFAFSDAFFRSTLRRTASRLRSQWYWLLVMLIVIISAILFNIYIYQLPENETFLSNANDSNRSVIGFFTQCSSFLGTIILLTCIPFPHHLEKFGLLIPATILAIIGFLAIGSITLRRRDQAYSGQLIGLLVMLGGLAAMICLGRPTEEIDQIWPSKFTGLGYFWLCIMIAHILDTFLREPNKKNFRRILIVGLVCIIWVQFVGETFCGTGISFFQHDISRRGQLRVHVQQRTAMEDLRSRLIDPIKNPDEPLFIPDLLNGSQFVKLYPELVFEPGESPGLWVFSAVLLDGLPIESRIVKPDSDRISPRFLQLIKKDKFLQQLYSSQDSP